MKAFKYVFVFILVLGLTVPALAEKPETPDIPDTGELYGDLYVILRDENGVPMLDGHNCIQPISSLDGEPFQLLTIISETDEEDDIECELTAEMATWVQAVDFGRLNLGRAPDAVINHAFDEAITKLNDATAITIDPPGRLVLTLSDGEIKTIDSPAENLSLYIKMMIDGHWITTDTAANVKGGRPEGKGPPEGDGPSTAPRPVLQCFNDDGSDTALKDNLDSLGYGDLCDSGREATALTDQELLLAASLLAAAADKFGSINLDKVIYINSIYGINQVGTLPGEVEGKTYFDFSREVSGLPFWYFRDGVYGVDGNRGSAECASDQGPGWIWVLQPVDDGTNHYEPVCMEILGWLDDPAVNAVHFTNMVEAYDNVLNAETNQYYSVEYDFLDNVRGFAQAAEDALQVLEYIHNYKVPEDLYP